MLYRAALPKIRPPYGATALLVAVFVLVCLVSQLAMRGTLLRGDEYTYVNGARALGAVLAGRSTLADAMPVVIGPGWFMPGLSILLAPLLAMVDHPAQWMIHAWMGLVNGTLLLATGLALRRHVAAIGLPLVLVFPGLVAAGQLALVTALPDFAAGFLLVLALVAALNAGMRMTAGQGLGWRQIVALELILAAALYLRGPMILPAVAIHGILFTIALARWRLHRQAILRLGGGMMMLALLLAPWTITVSRHFGEPVLTTTNVPLVLANSFGDPAKTCFGPCGEGADIWPAWHFAQDHARRTGQNPLAVQRQMMRSALDGLTVSGYLSQVKDHFGTFLLDPVGRVGLTLDVSYGVPRHLRQSLQGLIVLATWAVYLPFLIALIVANLGWLRRTDGQALQSLLLKAGTLCLFTQPFVHKCSPRYWTTFAPLAAWSAALLWQVLADRRRVAGPAAPPRQLPRVFDYVQMAYAAFFLCGIIVIGSQ